MAQRQPTATSRLRLKICLTAALELEGSGIFVTLRAGRSYASFAFLLHFCRLSERLRGNEVEYINISDEQFAQGIEEWNRAEDVRAPPSSVRELKTYWAIAVSTACIPVDETNDDMEAIHETLSTVVLK